MGCSSSSVAFTCTAVSEETSYRLFQPSLSGHAGPHRGPGLLVTAACAIVATTRTAQLCVPMAKVSKRAVTAVHVAGLFPTCPGRVPPGLREGRTLSERTREHLLHRSVIPAQVSDVIGRSRACNPWDRLVLTAALCSREAPTLLKVGFVPLPTWAGHTGL